MNRCVFRLRSRRIQIGLAALLALSSYSVTLYGQAGSPAHDSEPSFQIRMESNLVLVPVVVRDASGNLVHGLTRSDFKILDQKTEQAIAQFEEEYAQAPASEPSSGSAAAHIHTLPSRFLVLFFDDRNTSFPDLKQARDAADHYFAAGLAPEERVAIFTTNQMLTDFTADPQQIHTALMKVQRASPESSAGRPCPDLSDYQSMQLLEDTNPQSAAWTAALAEANGCSPTEFPVLGSHDVIVTTIRILAERIAARAKTEADATLQGFAKAVQSIAPMPGTRTVLMISPGFVSKDLQRRLEILIDAALRQQIVIDALDPSGVAISSRAFDASKHAEVGPHGLTDLYAVESDRGIAISDVLSQFTRGTGGELFHHRNDLAAGLTLLQAPQSRYILGFAPTEIKHDGKWHALDVSLVSPHKGYTISARRSYVAFATTSSTDARSQPAEISSAGAKPPATVQEAEENEMIREALYAQNDSSELPVAWAAKAVSGSSDSRDVTLFSHLDLESVALQKEGDRNTNRLTYIAAAFDRQNKLIAIKQRHATISVPDERIAKVKKEGVDLDMTLSLASGIYRLRTVVYDSAEHRIAASSRFVSVP